METRKTVSKSLATVTLSSLLGFLAARLSGIYQGTYDFYIAIFLIFVLITSCTYLLFYERIEEFWWSIHKRRNLGRPIFGILKQEGCLRSATRFTPEDWRQRLEELCKGREIKVETIQAEQISSKYTVVLNPYGEYYPEKDLVELNTLQEIKKYILNGGAFVNAGGFAFYHGWDWIRRREATLGKEFEGYQETGVPGSRLFVPARLWPASYAFSLTETPLNDFFKVMTTMGDPQTVRVYQDDTDRRYSGDISRVGGSDYIREFRAAREPLRNAQPLLRARWPNETSTTIVYPIIAIPTGKGCLVLAGMDLGSGIELGEVDLDRSGRDKIIHALINMIENQRNGHISLDWRKS